jgi:hypothetical protein
MMPLLPLGRINSFILQFVSIRTPCFGRAALRGMIYSGKYIKLTVIGGTASSIDLVNTLNAYL